MKVMRADDVVLMSNIVDDDALKREAFVTRLLGRGEILILLTVVLLRKLNSSIRRFGSSRSYTIDREKIFKKQGNDK